MIRPRAAAAIAATAAAASTAILAAGTARADGIDLAIFEPTPQTTGTGFQLQAPDVGVDSSWMISSILSYASNPLVLDVGSPGGTHTQDAVVQNSGLLQLGGAYAFLDRFEVGAHMPFYMQSGQAVDPGSGTFRQTPAKGTAIGNLTLHAKMQILRAEAGNAGALVLGASIAGVIPTATSGQFTGAGKAEGELLVLGAFTPMALDSRLTLSINGGPVIRGKSEYANIVQKSGVAWGVGASFHVVDPLWATAEVFGEATPSGETELMGSTQMGSMPTSSKQVLSPIEWLAGISFKAERRFTIGVAGGRGVTDALGTPDVRAMLSLSLVPGAPAIPPVHPPEPVKPDGDADGDGIPDSIDKCPNEPEDFDMFQDTDGCPDPDNDGDGIPDALDKCPLDPEDKDGFQDADGCPDPDNDHDGIPDIIDKCPNEPETINGFQDDDGCPDKGDTAIILSPDRIETLDPIQFIGNNKLTKASLPLLEQIGATLRAHSEIIRLRITVHVQPTADAEDDQARTDKRAQIIRDWLTNWGVATSRLEARGFGSRKPLVPPDQHGAAKLNDRIELIILERK
ncbi:MAG TPA: thrombospondin type 3 repeat-containing protein [Kofleriaceae bacterium]|nr:thrombospondin type 3 repeat-containing protein [Kofleriaceae bacterium]